MTRAFTSPAPAGSALVFESPIIRPAERPRVLVVSSVRLFRDSVALCLSRDASIEVVGAMNTHDALIDPSEFDPGVVIIDGADPAGTALPRTLRLAAPQAKIVAVAIPDDDEELLAWAEAGISAYVPAEGSLPDLVAAVHQAHRGELVCSPKLAALLLGRLAALSSAPLARPGYATLTRREREIVPLLEQGLSNKEIANHLSIGAATVKNHIHNILEKLQVQRRGEVAARVRQGGADRSVHRSSI